MPQMVRIIMQDWNNWNIFTVLWRGCFWHPLKAKNISLICLTANTCLTTIICSAELKTLFPRVGVLLFGRKLINIIAVKSNRRLFFCILDRDKAGGYGIQALGGMLVEYVKGDFLNVVGFPVNHFCKQLGMIYNSPPEMGCAGADGPIALSNSLSKCTENGETKHRGVCNFSSSDSASRAPTQEENVMEPECAKSNNEGFPHNIVDLLDGFKASKVHNISIFVSNWVIT